MLIQKVYMTANSKVYISANSKIYLMQIQNVSHSSHVIQSIKQKSPISDFFLFLQEPVDFETLLNANEK